MNVQRRKTVIFGKEFTFTVQDEELVLPKYRQIRGFIKEPSWCYKNLCKICGAFCIILTIILIGIGIGIYFGFNHIISPCNYHCKNGGECLEIDSFNYECKCRDGFFGTYCEDYDACWNHTCINDAKCIQDNDINFYCECKSGYYGKYCENYDVCLNNPCGRGDICESESYNSYEYTCTCKSKFFDSTCKSVLLGKVLLMANKSNKQLVTVDSKNRLRVWTNSSFKKSKLLINNDNGSIKSIAFLQNGLLAVGKIKIEIWNLKNESMIQSLTEHKGSVNALQLISFMNNSYLLSGSDDNSIRMWNERYISILTLSEHSGSVTALAFNAFLKMVASSAKDNTIKIWVFSYKVEAEKTSAHEYHSINSICILNNGLIATGAFKEIKIWKKLENERSLQLIANLSGHQNSVEALVVLKNNSLVSGSLDMTIKVWNQINATFFECKATLSKHNCEVSSLAVYQGALLISGHENGRIFVWNQTSFQLLQKISAHSSNVRSIILLNSGNLATGSEDKLIKIWKKVNETYFEFSNALANHTDWVNTLAVLPNNIFASASSDKSIRIWNQTNFECIHTLNDHKYDVGRLAVLENGYFVSISEDKTAIVWDSNSFSKISTIRNTDEFFCSVSSYFENLFITGNTKGTLKVWDIKSLEQFKSFQTKELLSIVFFTHNYLLSSHLNGVINIWKMDSMKFSQELQGHTSDVTCLINLNDYRFASGSADKTVKIWNYDFTNIATLSHHFDRINALILFEDSLISASSDTFLRIYSTRDIQAIHTFKPHSKAVQDIAILDDKNQLFATCSVDNKIKVWNNSILIANLSGHNDYVYTIEYSSNYKLLISGSRDRSIKLWNITDFNFFCSLYGHEDSVLSLAFIPEETKFASASCDMTVKIWDFASLSVNQTLTGHSDCVNALAVFKKYLLSGSSDTKIFIWNIQDKFQLIHKLKGHREGITSLVVLNNKVASASADKTIKIWQFSYQIEMEKAYAHSGSIVVICVLNNGLIATGSDDLKIKIWKKVKDKIQQITTLTEHKRLVRALTSLKNNSLASGSLDGTIKVWNQIKDDSFECIATLTKNMTTNNAIHSLASYKNDLLISGDRYGNLDIWNLTTFQMLQADKKHSSYILSVVVLNNGNLATASFDHTIVIWKYINGMYFEYLKQLTDHIREVNTLAVLPNNMFASASSDNLIKIWNQTTLYCIHTLKGHKNYVKRLAVLEIGYFVSISYGKEVIVWDTSSIRQIESLEIYSDVDSIAVYMNDSIIMGDETGLIALWSPVWSNASNTLEAHNDTVTDLAVLNNGYLTSASFDATILTWDISFNLFKQKKLSQSVLALNLFQNGSLISSSLDGTVDTWDTDDYILNDTIYREN